MKHTNPLLQGKIMKANGEDWYNDPRNVVRANLLDNQGNNLDVPRPIPSFIGKDYDDYSSNLYICEMCYGTGKSVIVSIEIHKQLEKIKGKESSIDPSDYPRPLDCPGCAGKGIPPIPYGEVSDEKTRPSSF